MRPIELYQLSRDPRTRNHPAVQRALHIPMGGVIVSSTVVRQHRYLRDHRLLHSKTVADVLLPRDTGTIAHAIAA